MASGSNGPARVTLRQIEDAVPHSSSRSFNQRMDDAEASDQAVTPQWLW